MFRWLRDHGVIERSSIMVTDGRYSGVTKGACVGHMVPEAFEGGGIGTLMSGDLLWMRLSQRRIDLIDREAFLSGRIEPLPGAPFDERQALLERRKATIEARQRQIAASNVLDSVSSAEHGVVPLSVHRRATIPWSF